MSSRGLRFCRERAPDPERHSLISCLPSGILRSCRMFSARVQADLAPNRLAQAVERAREAGRRIIDLTESNPTRAGFDYPADLLAPLGDRGGLAYSPEPLGAPDARR